MVEPFLTPSGRREGRDGQSHSDSIHVEFEVRRSKVMVTPFGIGKHGQDRHFGNNVIIQIIQI